MFILTKIPSDVSGAATLCSRTAKYPSLQIGLEIPYAPVFSSSALPETCKSLLYERAGVLFNLAALYSQLGAAEDRSTPQGLKQALKLYQASTYPVIRVNSL